MIEVKNINKKFNNKQILFDVSTKFESGRTNLIIGQSGHGKTVLLKSIVGLHKIDSGKIIYGNQDFSNMGFKDQRTIRQQIGMLFQGSALFDSLNVEENIRFPLDMFTNQSAEEKLERVNFCLKRVNLDNINQLYPSEISGGMQKRVAIARAISLKPKYLFCDEPNSGLDPKTSIVIDNLIYEITKEYGITTIINTHDMNSVMGIGENIIFIHKGKKLWEGSKSDILTAKDEKLNDFVFASELFKRIKNSE